LPLNAFLPRRLKSQHTETCTYSRALTFENLLRQASEPFLLLDVREGGQWCMCHLPEAYNVPLHSLMKEEKEVLSALEDACVAANAAQIYVTLKPKLNPKP